jgi:hypothetical protein
MVNGWMGGMFDGWLLTRLYEEWLDMWMEEWMDG